MMAPMRYLLSIVLVAGVVSIATAHDLDWSGEMALGEVEEQIHADDAPWAGWVNVTVTNNGSEPWGDFHFEIYDPYGGQDISLVDWVVDSPYEPQSSQSPLTWDVDNATIGATIDLFFYTDPVYPGDTATFSVYNVNPDQVSFFGVAFLSDSGSRAGRAASARFGRAGPAPPVAARRG